MRASLLGHYDAVKLLLDLGAELNKGNVYAVTPLMQAAQHDSSTSPAVIRLLLQRGANINAVSTQGGTAVGYAAGLGNVESMKTLIENRAQIDVIEHNGNTPLLSALWRGHHEIVKLFLAAGVNYQRSTPGRTGVLQVLASTSDEKMMEMFTKARLRGIQRQRTSVQRKSLLDLFNERRSTPQLRQAFNNLLDSIEYEESTRAKDGEVECVMEQSDTDEEFHDDHESLQD